MVFHSSSKDKAFSSKQFFFGHRNLLFLLFPGSYYFSYCTGLQFISVAVTFVLFLWLKQNHLLNKKYRNSAKNRYFCNIALKPKNIMTS